MMKTLKLRNDVEIPVDGYGVYQITKDICTNCVLDALNAGYRHIDTAQAFFNEKEVGDAIVESGIPRRELFISSKVWIENYDERKTYQSVLDTMKKLQTDYLDLVVLHQPIGDYHNAYKNLEKLYSDGIVRAIGVTNFTADKLVDLCIFSEVKPMVVQLEVNPFNQQLDLEQWAKKYGVVIEAWAPFAEKRNNLFNNEVLINIAKKHNKSVAQVILNWLQGRDIVTLAKTVHADRLKENLDVNSFILDIEDLNTIKSLDKKMSSFFSYQDPAIIEWYGDLIEKRKKMQQK